MGKIYVIMGKSASGKDTVYGEVKAMLPALRGFVMYTTRPMRSGEEDGVSYHFVTPAFVEEAEKNGTLIEKRVYDTVYGPWIYATIDDGQIDPLEGDYLIPGTLES
ncbi:MAG: guanylate kinase, partial [Lachnospiraceae bacterium]|nr:guanylate kinase [Candidatus Hippenecus merdae]